MLARAKGIGSLGYTCPPQPTTDYQQSVIDGLRIATDPTTLATMDDVNQLKNKFNPFYPGITPTVLEAQNSTYPYKYVDGTGRKVYTLGYGLAIYNVGQTLNMQCNNPGGLWAVVAGKPTWVASQGIADSYNKAYQDTHPVTHHDGVPYVPQAVNPSPQTGSSGNNSSGSAGSTPSMTANDGVNGTFPLPDLSSMFSGLSSTTLLIGAALVGFLMLRK